MLWYNETEMCIICLFTVLIAHNWELGKPLLASETEHALKLGKQRDSREGSREQPDLREMVHYSRPAPYSLMFSCSPLIQLKTLELTS